MAISKESKYAVRKEIEDFEQRKIQLKRDLSIILDKKKALEDSITGIDNSLSNLKEDIK